MFGYTLTTIALRKQGREHQQRLCKKRNPCAMCRAAGRYASVRWGTTCGDLLCSKCAAMVLGVPASALLHWVRQINPKRGDPAPGRDEVLAIWPGLRDPE